MKFVSSIFLTIFIVAAPFVLAHGVGSSIEKTVGDYLVDVGYSPDEVKEGEAVQFDFSLWNNALDQEEPFTDIWVRISQSNKTVFAGGIVKPGFGPTGITYVFPERGEYEIMLRFQNNESSLVETSFPITAEVGGETTGGNTFFSTNLFVTLLVGIVLGWLIALIITRKAKA